MSSFPTHFRLQGCYIRAKFRAEVHNVEHIAAIPLCRLYVVYTVLVWIRLTLCRSQGSFISEIRRRARTHCIGLLHLFSVNRVRDIKNKSNVASVMLTLMRLWCQLNRRLLDTRWTEASLQCPILSAFSSHLPFYST